MVACDVRRAPFVPSGSLRHLDDDLLPFLQELFDLRLGTLVALAVRDRGAPPFAWRAGAEPLARPDARRAAATAVRPAAGASSSSVSRRSNSSKVATTSDT